MQSQKEACVGQFRPDTTRNLLNTNAATRYGADVDAPSFDLLLTFFLIKFSDLNEYQFIPVGRSKRAYYIFLTYIFVRFFRQPYFGKPEVNVNRAN